MFRQIQQIMSDLGSDLAHVVSYAKYNSKGNRIEKKYFAAEASQPPVVLIQGFLSTRGVLEPLESYLRATGRDVVSIDLGILNVGDIRASASRLDAKIEKIFERFSERHGFDQVDMIGHSMGGLIALYYVKRLGGHRVVRKVIALGAPFHGTWASLMGLPFGVVMRSLWQMLPGSSFISEIQRRPQEMRSVEMISIAAKYDAVCPPSACRLEHAKNEVVDVGHAGLLMDHRVFKKIEEHLNRPHRSYKNLLYLDRGDSRKL